MLQGRTPSPLVRTLPLFFCLHDAKCAKVQPEAVYDINTLWLLIAACVISFIAVPWNLYLPHREFLERFDSELLVDERDRDAYTEAFARLSEAYLREVEPQQAMVCIFMS